MDHRRPLRLNVASGNHPSGEWGIDVDLYLDADVRATVASLPFPAGVFSAAYLGHFLEHVPWGLIPDLGAEVRRTMAPGAVVMAVGPCIHRAVATGQPRWLLEAILSDPRTVDVQPGIHHAWTPTEDLTVEAMVRAGFTGVEAVPIEGVVKPFWPNPTQAPWQCAVRGVNPG